MLSLSDLRIPFDAVIARVLNRVAGVPWISRYEDIKRNFDELTDWSRSLLPDDHMVIEDLWY